MPQHILLSIMKKEEEEEEKEINKIYGKNGQLISIIIF